MDFTSENICLKTDSYKPSHFPQYQPGTRGIYSYLESRGGRWPASNYFGGQAIMKRHLVGKVVTREKIDHAKEFFAQHYGNPAIFNEAGWSYILHAHGGRLPVTIRAVPEGTTVWNRNVLMTIENTDPACYWLTNYLETLLLQVWYPITISTQSREMKKIWLEYLRKTGDPAGVGFKLHDFGYRGSTSYESAGIGAAAHLVHFMGTDTIAGIEHLYRYYNAKSMPGNSIPAAEHSTITSWGLEREPEAMANMFQKFPTGLVAIVADSRDVMYAASEIWGKTLKDVILSRDGVAVFRPDSGKPDEIVLGVLQRLGDAFGVSINDKGYKVLHPKVRVIQGDGIDYETCRIILDALERSRWSADNIAMGSGGGLLQKVDRDTQRFAFKCSATNVNSRWYDVYKQPATDPSKNSKRGRLKLIKQNGEYLTVAEDSGPAQDELVEVFRDGTLLVDQTIDEIRARAAEGL
jgi:nicotinamide phosphoribosyltransferase